jgi:hypothetical protein
MRSIAGDTVFDRTDWVVVRPQRSNYLLYNSRTDEMHLVPPTGHVVYALCDGFNSVETIVRQLVEAIGDDPIVVRERLIDFLADLQSRGLVERADD